MISSEQNQAMPIVLGPTGALALPQQEDHPIIREQEIDKIQPKEDKTDYDQFNQKKEGYFFADQIQIDGELIFTIPFEDQMKDENDLPKRKSRWGDRPQIRQKIQNPVIFNPLQGLKTGYGLLQLTHESIKIGNIYSTTPQEPQQQSRWGAEYEKTFHPPLLNFIPQQISDDDFEYLIRLYRLDEINNKQICKTKNILDDEDCRSPSPEPIYNEAGKRINTRETTEYEAIQKEKHNLIEECMKINPTFVPPHDYKPLKKTKKIYLPESHADQLKQRIIGPKGATHKSLEQQTGCKISIKGKGSGNGNRRVDNDTNDKLHVFITASTDEQLEKATKLIDEILRGDDKKSDVPVNQIQLINGIINQDYCSQCHQTGHKSYECTKSPFIKVDIKCTICGDRGHVTQDCKFKKEYKQKLQEDAQNINQKDVNQQYADFLIQVEGENANKLLDYAKDIQQDYAQTKTIAVANTSFITDQIQIDPNQLMLKYDPEENQKQQQQQQNQTNIDYNLKLKEELQKKLQEQKMLEEFPQVAQVNNDQKAFDQLNIDIFNQQQFQQQQQQLQPLQQQQQLQQYQLQQNIQQILQGQQPAYYQNPQVLQQQMTYVQNGYYQTPLAQAPQYQYPYAQPVQNIGVQQQTQVQNPLAIQQTTQNIQQQVQNPYAVQQLAQNPYAAQQALQNPYAVQQTLQNPYAVQQPIQNQLSAQQQVQNSQSTQQQAGQGANPMSTLMNTSYYQPTIYPMQFISHLIPGQMYYPQPQQQTNGTVPTQLQVPGTGVNGQANFQANPQQAAAFLQFQQQLQNFQK